MLLCDCFLQYCKTRYVADTLDTCITFIRLASIVKIGASVRRYRKEKLWCPAPLPWISHRNPLRQGCQTNSMRIAAPGKCPLPASLTSPLRSVRFATNKPMRRRDLTKSAGNKEQHFRSWRALLPNSWSRT